MPMTVDSVGKKTSYSWPRSLIRKEFGNAASLLRRSPITINVSIAHTVIIYYSNLSC
jgi:hypothetical protein